MPRSTSGSPPRPRRSAPSLACRPRPPCAAGRPPSPPPSHATASSAGPHVLRQHGGEELGIHVALGHGPRAQHPRDRRDDRLRPFPRPRLGPEPVEQAVQQLGEPAPCLERLLRQGHSIACGPDPRVACKNASAGASFPGPSAPASARSLPTHPPDAVINCATSLCAALPSSRCTNSVKTLSGIRATRTRTTRDTMV